MRYFMMIGSDVELAHEEAVMAKATGSVGGTATVQDIRGNILRSATVWREDSIPEEVVSMEEVII